MYSVIVIMPGTKEIPSQRGYNFSGVAFEVLSSKGLRDHFFPEHNVLHTFNNEHV